MQVFIDNFLNDQAFFLQTVLIMVLFLLFFIIMVSIIRLKKTVKLVTHNQDGMNIEAIINQYYVDVEEVKNVQGQILVKQEYITNVLQRCISKVGVIRFNPFAEVGGDQSFVVALLDSNNNGMVISSLYNRANSRFYGKPIINGKSNYTLSEEEQQAIDQAMNGNDEKVGLFA